MLTEGEMLKKAPRHTNVIKDSFQAETEKAINYTAYTSLTFARVTDTRVLRLCLLIAVELFQAFQNPSFSQQEFVSVTSTHLHLAIVQGTFPISNYAPSTIESFDAIVQLFTRLLFACNAMNSQ